MTRHARGGALLMSGLLVLPGACASHMRREPRSLTTSEAAEAAAARPQPALIEVRLLLVAFGRDGGPGARSREEAERRVEIIASMARSGSTSFANLVRQYSDREGAADDYGLFRMRPSQPNVFGEAVLEAALATPPGRVSRPVETADGFYLLERRDDPPSGPAQVSARHILISFREAERALPGVERTREEARALVEQVAREAKAGANWDALAAQHTDEPGSRETGGDLGSFGRGRMVAAFEKTAFGLQVGEVSDVIETPFGFHVIQRYE